ncbi:MAG: hypothetical protein LBL00_01750 [Endomicrobium sp.]|jgi:hypothetical protein|nr:hypothetical protein [Endomicrobium sp.]
MKKIILGLLLVFIGIRFCFADRPSLFFAAACGNVGLETNFSLDENKEGLWFLSASFGDFFVQHEKTGLGFSYIPIVFIEGGKRRGSPGKYYSDTSLLNTEIFWSPFKIKDGMTVGPFANLNYFMDKEEIAYKIGLKFSLFSESKEPDHFNFVLNWLTGEMGYSRIDNTNNFFANIKIDILELVYFLALMQ